MSRWIDADKLLENCIIKNKDGEPIGKRSFVSEFDIDTAHYIDIVRCFECKYWNTKGKYYGKCEYHAVVIMNADDFCSYGERRE